jgi:SulP family sulfate permease
MAQGIANLISPFFGGMPATGTIARTVTNIESGGNTPLAGILHACTLLVIILFAAPLAKDIPLACLAAILMYVAWNMGEWKKFIDLKQFRLPYRLTIVSVFLLTVILDLTIAVEVGLLLAFITFIYRISSLSSCEKADGSNYPQLIKLQGRIDAYRIYGAIFFGAVKLLETIEENLPTEALLLDLKNVIYIDSSGMETITELAHLCKVRNIKLIICGLEYQPHEMAKRSGFLNDLSSDCLYPNLTSGLKAVII